MRGVNSGEGHDQQILLVLATENFRNTLSRILSRCGYRIRTVETAEQALEQLDRASYDVLVSEAYLPGMSGLTLLYSIRDRGFSLPVILVAESLTERFRWIVSGMGQVHCLSSPVDLDQLKQILSSCLGARAGARAARAASSEAATSKS